jgi:hypothetical protein
MTAAALPLVLSFRAPLLAVHSLPCPPELCRADPSAPSFRSPSAFRCHSERSVPPALRIAVSAIRAGRAAEESLFAFVFAPCSVSRSRRISKKPSFRAPRFGARNLLFSFAALRPRVRSGPNRPPMAPGNAFRCHSEPTLGAEISRRQGSCGRGIPHRFSFLVSRHLPPPRITLSRDPRA